MSHKHYKPDILHPWIHPKQKLWPCRWCHLWSVCGPRSSHTKILLTEGQEKSPRPKSFQMDVKCFCDRDVTCDIPYHSQFGGIRRVVTILKTNAFQCSSLGKQAPDLLWCPILWVANMCISRVHEMSNVMLILYGVSLSVSVYTYKYKKTWYRLNL